MVLLLIFQLSLFLEPEKVFLLLVIRAGLSAFTKIYSDEYAKYNIRMNNILPGFIDSLKTKNEFIKEFH